ncbi:MAG: 2-C-methyl-D-erythritol 4-phosphate cytidylyltransferase [Muribaculaceae bacterium]|nr:2-C-methyl-D-erythritol 4-phosphate cytidylyltransferase [Muribaculaceae bacterium]
MYPKYAIIVAGGVGSRSGDSLPKQFHDICGHPMLWWSVRAFHNEDPTTKIIVVMHPDYIELWKKTCGEDCPKHTVVAGGSTRTMSVAAGLAQIPFNDDALVAVHDAARPLVSERMIREGYKMASERSVGIPAVPVTESIRKGSLHDSIAVDRSEFHIVQTPQVFNNMLIHLAYEEALKSADHVFTDDASVISFFGHPIRMYQGDPTNIKVTYPDDFIIAEYRLSKS